MSHLTVVKNLHENTTPRIANLHERLMEQIYEYAAQFPSGVCKAEIVGTLEFVKAQIMTIEFKE